MISATPLLRVLTLSDVVQLVDWARIEGWNPARDDASAFHAADPQGFIGCFVDGQMVAGISAVAYDHLFGFIGLYITRPDMRGKGYGRRVWDAGMARLGTRTIGLDGVPEQQNNYASMGFVPLYQTHRWSGRLDGFVTTPGPTQSITPDLIPAILAYDRALFPAPREAFLRIWLSEPHRTRAILRNGAICGYGVARRCAEGFKVGPLFADGPEDAAILLASLSADMGDATLHIDVPDMRIDLADRLAAAGLSRGFSTARMYRGALPYVPTNRIFGISTLELG